MDVENLVRMANRIGDFFQAMPDREEAIRGVAQHIRRFWEPRMRGELLAHVESAGSDGLSPLVAAAIRAHADDLRPK